jgi:hypothetical protein
LTKWSVEAAFTSQARIVGISVRLIRGKFKFFNFFNYSDREVCVKKYAFSGGVFFVKAAFTEILLVLSNLYRLKGFFTSATLNHVDLFWVN